MATCFLCLLWHATIESISLLSRDFDFYSAIYSTFHHHQHQLPFISDRKKVFSVLFSVLCSFVAGFSADSPPNTTTNISNSRLNGVKLKQQSSKAWKNRTQIFPRFCNLCKTFQFLFLFFSFSASSWQMLILEFDWIITSCRGESQAWTTTSFHVNEKPSNKINYSTFPNYFFHTWIKLRQNLWIFRKYSLHGLSFPISLTTHIRLIFTRDPFSSSASHQMPHIFQVSIGNLWNGKFWFIWVIHEIYALTGHRIVWIYAEHFRLNFDWFTQPNIPHENAGQHMANMDCWTPHNSQYWY